MIKTLHTILSIFLFSIIFVAGNPAIVFALDINYLDADNILDYDVQLLKEGEKDNEVIYYFRRNLTIDKDLIDYNGELLEESITERTINSETFYTKDNKKILKLYSRPKFYYENGDWYLISTATTTLNQIQSKLLEKDISYSYPYALAENNYFTSCDGDISHLDAGGTNWNDIRTGTGTHVSQSTTEERGPAITKTGGNYEWLHRGIFIFDTSDIGTDTIDSASFFVVGDSASTYSWVNNNGDVILSGGDEDIIQCPLQAGDFNSVDFNIYSYQEWANITKDDSTYTEFELNTDGKNYINKTGNTVFSFLWRADLSSDDPSAPGDSNFYWWSTDETGTSKDPYLQIVLGVAEQPAEAAYNIASTSTEISYLNFPLILIIFIAFFLLIFVFGKYFLTWLKKILYDRY